MNHSFRCLMAGILVVLAACSDGFCQDTIFPVSDDGWLAEPTDDAMLQALPRPPDLPASLFDPPPPPATRFNPLDAPYFLPEPLLDPPELSPPGWFAGAEVDVLRPRLIHQLTDRVQFANNTAATVSLPFAPLDWTAAPKIVVGYRPAAGFGEFAVTYRELNSTGSQGIVGASGPGALASHLNFNLIDADYRSEEMSLWPNWDMKWSVGVRTLIDNFGTQAGLPSAQAFGGSVSQMQATNRSQGVGPHAGLQLARPMADSGFSLVLRSDVGSELVRSHQSFDATSVTLGPGGLPLRGATNERFWTNLTMFTSQAGVGWQPRSRPNVRVFVGYQYEYWFNLGTNETANGGVGTSRTDLANQGLVLQYNWRF